MKRGQIFWVAFDPALGGEIQKTRPAVILSIDSMNRSMNRLQVVPLTTKAAHVLPGEAIVWINGRPQKALANQIRTVAKQRVGRLSGELTPAGLQAVESAVLLQLGLSEPSYEVNTHE